MNRRESHGAAGFLVETPRHACGATRTRGPSTVLPSASRTASSLRMTLVQVQEVLYVFTSTRRIAARQGGACRSAGVRGRYFRGTRVAACAGISAFDRAARLPYELLVGLRTAKNSRTKAEVSGRCFGELSCRSGCRRGGVG